MKRYLSTLLMVTQLALPNHLHAEVCHRGGTISAPRVGPDPLTSCSNKLEVEDYFNLPDRLGWGLLIIGATEENKPLLVTQFSFDGVISEFEAASRLDLDDPQKVEQAFELLFQPMVCGSNDHSFFVRAGGVSRIELVMLDSINPELEPEPQPNLNLGRTTSPWQPVGSIDVTSCEAP